MLGQRLGSFIRLLLGIILLQSVTVLVTYTALRTDFQVTWPLFVAMAGGCGLLVTFWFESLIGGARVHALARVQKQHAAEREKLRLQAEREKARLNVKQTQVRNQTGSRVKTGLLLGSVTGLGIAMMFTQFVTVGLLTVVAGGGMLLGYGFKARQTRRYQDQLPDQHYHTIGITNENTPRLPATRKGWFSRS
jgi:hypothetical protein